MVWPFENNTKKVEKRLAKRSLAADRGRNMVAVFTIGLAVCLMASVAFIYSAMHESTVVRLRGQYQSGCSELSYEDIERLAASGRFESWGYEGDGGNIRYADTSITVHFYDEGMRELMRVEPITGAYPKKENEICVERGMLRYLNMPEETGQSLRLDMGDGEQEYIISGILEKENTSRQYDLYISEALAAKGGEKPFTIRFRMKGGDMEQPEHLRTEIKLFYEEMGIPERVTFYSSTYFDLNDIYLGSDMPVYGVALLIAVVCAVVIYNIFYINVTADIRYYGLLKTIGTTGRQLRRMVRGQAFLLSAAGIPLGLLLGWFVGKGALPTVYAGLETGGVQNVSINPLIFVGSAIFSLLVVYLSCINPCRLATKVSPIEAVRYVENVQYKKKEKKSAKVSMTRLAMANMGRNRRKAVLVIVSLSLSMILINGTYALIKGFSFDKYVQSYLLTDMQVSHFSMRNLSSQDRDFQAVTPEIISELERFPGVEKVRTLKMGYVMTELSEELTENYVSFFKSEEMAEYSSYMEEMLDEVKKSRKVDSHTYWMEDDLLPYIDILEGDFDKEKFDQGGYAVLFKDYFTGWAAGSVGEKITLKGWEEREGVEKELEIMAVATLPYAAGTRSSALGCGMVLLGKKDFEELCDVKGGLHAFLDVEKGADEQVIEAINGWIEDGHTDLVLTSKEYLRKEFSRELGMFSIIGGLLGAILALIGILNLINATVTGILARRQEFAMMQAVGMTGKQLEQMLTMEGIWYGVWTLGIAATVGNVVSYGLIYMLGKNMAYFEWSFHILPLVLSIPVIAALALAIPVCCYHGLCKKSIIERLRMAEV